MMVNKCRILDQYSRDKASYYKNYNEKKGKNHDCGKPYASPYDKGKNKAYDEKKPSERGALASVKCYRCGDLGHYVDACTNKVLRCYRCDKVGHRVSECKSEGPTCFNYGEQGHIITQCQKPKKNVVATAHTNGKVFSRSGS
ncbi:unnamed protein product [Vicia faba]|uniref:CCHC-type domain-containing protein n=1 Tax=Vicia faba TaxID=3906 RepID=A0AAV1AE37_VICFA|nr:unnamed protein product [Vicia faba]